MAHELPRPLRRWLLDYRLHGRPSAGFVIGNLPVDVALIGPTPVGVEERLDLPELRRADALLHLVGSLLGDPFSLSGRQGGGFVDDLFPVVGHVGGRGGAGVAASSSSSSWEWQSEDAVHPCGADWSLLLGLRNEDRAATGFAVLDAASLSERDRTTLFEKRFNVLPGALPSLGDGPEPVALLEGDRRAPRLRAVPSLLRGRAGDREAEEARGALLAALDACLTEVVIGPGELLVLDNKRVVLGSRPAAARYDGTDRWFKRVCLTADLRRGEDLCAAT